MPADASQTARQDLWRASLTTLCLQALVGREYGYALLASLQSAGVPVDGNTLYPLLRKLESNGILLSEWETGQGRPRKFYSLTPQGDELRRALVQDLDEVRNAATLLKKASK